MSQALHRHDLSDHHWSLLEGHLPGRTGAWGGIAHDNRRFINAVLWIFRIGSPWRDLPVDYGDWFNTHRAGAFVVGAIRVFWEKLLEVVMDEPDFEWLMIDATHCKGSSTCRRRTRWQSSDGTHKRGQHKEPSDRGCAWYAAQSDCYSGYRGGLQPSRQSVLACKQST